MTTPLGRGKPLSMIQFGFAGLLLALGFVPVLHGAEAARFTGIERQANGEVLVRLAAPPGLNYRLEWATNPPAWSALLTAQSTGEIEHTDAAAPYQVMRYYRAAELDGTNHLTGDHLATDDGDVVFHPVNHASFIMGWNAKTIYSDPVGGPTPYRAFPKADLIVVTHGHGDHFHAGTLEAVRGPEGVIVAPPAVYSSMSAALRSRTTALANGDSTNVMGIGLEAVPAYNANHPKGAGNSYVLTMGGRRIFVSGDTEDVPEMRALTSIDVAFLCMNLPFTMSIQDAASAVREFKPKVVYPYHFRNQNGSFSDLEQFKELVGTESAIEVRVRDWY